MCRHITHDVRKTVFHIDVITFPQTLVKSVKIVGQEMIREFSTFKMANATILNCVATAFIM